MKNDKKTASDNGECAVMVTTEHRGVFFGYLDPGTVNADPLTLKRARCCLSWSADVKGFLGLATTGPTKGCRVGPAATELVLHKITSVSRVEPEAVKAWEASPWTR